MSGTPDWEQIPAFMAVVLFSGLFDNPRFPDEPADFLVWTQEKWIDLCYRTADDRIFYITSKLRIR
jgi:hypothetical protein